MLLLRFFQPKTGWLAVGFFALADRRPCHTQVGGLTRTDQNADILDILGVFDLILICQSF
jgi:hypothetical protein